ncbi:MAG: carboxypeptidase-like regulatory domain-containing protein, partial [Bacteroidota bacterium]
MKYFYIRSLILSIFLIMVGFKATAQTGTIRGKVVDGENGEPLLGATVRLLSLNEVKGGAYSDIEGAYTIKASPGTYQLLTSYISYVTDTTEITLVDGKIESIQILLLAETSVRADLAVTITAKTSEASSVAFDQKKKNSINSIDGVTFDLVQRTGDANVAAAMQRVVGVTVQDGKYVYVRGLGDRYSQTLLNGANMPSLDPSRNTVQMDIFPSNLIDNVVVYKNFTPDLPGSFTGGLIDVRTKDFPDRFTLNASASMGYNLNSSLRDNFLTDTRNQADGFGYDDGLREVPEIIGEPGSFLPGRLENQDFEIANRIDQSIKAFQVPLYPVMDNSFLDQNYQLSAGNQFQLGEKVSLGAVGSLSYRNEYEFTDEGGNALFTISGPNDRRLGQEQDLRTVSRTQHNVLWGGMGRISLKVGPANKVSFNYLHNQSGSSEARYLRGTDDSNTKPGLESRSTNYFERSLDVFQLNGEHKLGPVSIDWIGSRAFTRQNQPDQRFISNFVDDTDP